MVRMNWVRKELTGCHDSWSLNFKLSTVQSSIIRINGNELTVKQVQPEHAGTYTCLAIQKLGTFKNVQEREIKVVVERKFDFSA